MFSLAATMYALLDGKPPRWPDEGTPSLPEIFELQRVPIEPLPDVHPRLMDVLLGALADDAEKRPTASEFRDQLKAIDFADTPISVPPSKSPPVRRDRRRLPLLIGLIAVVLAAVVVVGMAIANLRQPAAVNPPVPASPTAAPTTEPAPTPTPTPTSEPTSTAPTVPAPPEGLVDCSSLLGSGAFCPTEPECWFQFGSLNDFPAVANPVSCNEFHQHQTFASGRVNYRIRLQSQLDNDPFVQRLCSLPSVRKVVVGERVEEDWGTVAYPPQGAEDNGYFKCLVSTGEERTTPLRLRK